MGFGLNMHANLYGNKPISGCVTETANIRGMIRWCKYSRLYMQWVKLIVKYTNCIELIPIKEIRKFSVDTTDGLLRLPVR